MPERPLILFPTPEISTRTKMKGFRTTVHRPTHNRQGQRLSPIFTQLQAEVTARRLELQATAAGADPEQVLVIETIGSTENFANAVKRISGFEWMGELETDEITADNDFYDEDDTDKNLNGRLYLILFNQRALSEMLSLWNLYKDNPDMIFDRGLTRFREVFLSLKDLRRWGVQDRIEETGLLKEWQEILQFDEHQSLRFEIEMWFRNSVDQRQAASEKVIQLIGQLGGNVLTTCTINEIAYHALLTEIPANVARQIIAHPDVDLIKCDSVMFFRPVGQMITEKQSVEARTTNLELEDVRLPSGEPIIAIFDGLPLTNHSLLRDRLIIDDPDDYASSYTVPDRRHGTAMASLIIHGDLSEGASPLSRPIYVRPIMKPKPWIESPRYEGIPEDVLVVDYIHRAVLRMISGEGTGVASAPTIKIINFAIGDPCRQFIHSLSPLARLLDWLSIKYGILFVISAGNHSMNITTGITRADFDVLPENEKEATIVRALYNDARNRKIFSPGESINGITVGALHYDSAGVINNTHAVDLFPSILPSTFSAFGSGHRRAIKPDILFNGGRVLFTEHTGTNPNKAFDPIISINAPGTMVASPSELSGDINKVIYCCGTSNAASLVTRFGSECHDTLIDVFEEQAPEVEINSYLTPLVKALLVHGCSWGETGVRLQNILQTPENGQQIRSMISRWLGYGIPNKDRSLICTPQRATLIGFGQLADEEAHLFTLPIPPSLSARRDLRRLTVTLAWLSPIVPGTQKYRGASLWFEVDGDRLVTSRKEADSKAVRRGTVQHEVFEGSGAIAISEDENLTIKVNCRKDAAKIISPITYGLVVSLEVAEGTDIAIYNEIRTRIMSVIQIRQ